MPNIVVDELADLQIGRFLMVSYHKKTQEWWAYIGHEKTGKPVDDLVASASTPMAALGELMALCGGGLQSTN